MYIDPDFEIGSSSTINKYAEKTPPPTGNVTFVHTVMQNVSEVLERRKKREKRIKINV
jgi:hypothetical protein